MRVGKIASGAKYRENEQLRKWIIFGILTVFQIKKIRKISNLENDKIFEII